MSLATKGDRGEHIIYGDMDNQQHAQNSLEQYRLLTARETGLEFGRGSYAAVVEVDYKGLRCAGKKIH